MFIPITYKISAKSIRRSWKKSLYRVRIRVNEDNLQQVIAQPLNHKSTTSILTASINLATGYNETGNPTPYWTLDGFIGAGAIYSSVHDLLLYSQAQIHTSNTNLRSIFTTQHQKTFQAGGLDVGLGWLLVTINGVECLFHDGGTGGFRSFILISVSKKTAVVVLANNADEDVAELAQRISADVIK